jgi:hypothetical protein
VEAERKAAEERERQRAAELEKARLEREAAEAREKARVEAERKAAEERERQKAAELEKARLEREAAEAREKARLESERKAAAERARQEREEAEAREKARVEAELKAAEERERQKAADLEKARLEREAAEAREKARLEAERKAAAERARQERAEVEAREKARVEGERKAAEERERQKAAELERARLEQERLESERKAAEEREKARLERERRAAEERARQEREEAEAREKARVEAERKAAEERQRKENAAREKARREQERIERKRKAAEERKAAAPTEAPIYRKPAAIGLAILLLALGVYFFRPGTGVTEIPLSPVQVSLSAQTGARTSTSEDVALGDAKVPYQTHASDTWITVTPDTGDHLQTLHVSASTIGLKPGSYTGGIEIVPSDAGKYKFTNALIPVHLTISAETIRLSVQPTTLAFSYRDGDPPPRPRFISIPSGMPASLQTRWENSGDHGWAQVDRGAKGLQITVQPKGVAVGIHAATLVVEVPGAADSPQRVAISLRVIPALGNIHIQ